MEVAGGYAVPGSQRRGREAGHGRRGEVLVTTLHRDPGHSYSKLEVTFMVSVAPYLWVPNTCLHLPHLSVTQSPCWPRYPPE